MTDPLGLINTSSITNRTAPLNLPGSRGSSNRAADNAPGFKEMLQQQIEQVNQLQHDANAAVEDLAAGRRDDLESVITATQKADLAFRMLLQVRNKMMDAYEEVKQIRI